MLSRRKAGIDPGRWAYATLPRHTITKRPTLPQRRPWPLFWSLEVLLPLPATLQPSLPPPCAAPALRTSGHVPARAQSFVLRPRWRDRHRRPRSPLFHRRPPPAPPPTADVQS